MKIKFGYYCDALVPYFFCGGSGIVMSMGVTLPKTVRGWSKSLALPTTRTASFSG